MQFLCGGPSDQTIAPVAAALWPRLFQALRYYGVTDSGCRKRGSMFGFSIADWIFICAVLVTIFVCVGISDMRKK
jgi:hypothetical protein